MSITNNNDCDLLVVKTKYNQEQNKTKIKKTKMMIYLQPVYESKKQKRIRLKGSSIGQNKRIFQNDNGEKDEDIFGIIKQNDNNQLSQTNEELVFANN